VREQRTGAGRFYRDTPPKRQARRRCMPAKSEKGGARGKRQLKNVAGGNWLHDID